MFAVALSAALIHSFYRVQESIAQSQPAGASSAQTELVAITFESKWCGPCRILKPRLAEVKPDFMQEPVRFLELSFTFGEQKNFPQLARDEGFEAAYQRFRGGTGYTVLVDRETGDVLDILTMDYSPDAMRAAISRALAVAMATPVDGASQAGSTALKG